jgi:hypothetical protein
MSIRPPHVRTITFLSSACYIYHDASVQVWDFSCLATISNISGLIYSFSSSGQEYAYCFLQIPPHDGHPCIQLTLRTAKACSDLHLELSPMLDAQKKRNMLWRVPFHLIRSYPGGFIFKIKLKNK